MSGKAGYLISEGVKNLRANRQMSIASIGVLIACMLLIGASVLFSANVNAIMGYVESMNEVVVWVADAAGDAEITDMGESLAKMDNIAKVTYVSKEAALAQERERMGAAAVLLDGFEDDNPYPASYILQLGDLSKLDATLAGIYALSGVDTISAPTELAATLTDVKTGVSVAGLTIVGILTVVSIIIVSNTIKVTVFNRRREINIMKYVGATDSFIRIPFLVEGMIIGLISALMAFALLWVGYGYVTQWVSGTSSSWLGAASAYLIDFMDIAPMIFGGFAAAGAGFGFFGSLFFVGRYLRV